MQGTTGLKLFRPDERPGIESPATPGTIIGSPILGIAGESGIFHKRGMFGIGGSGTIDAPLRCRGMEREQLFVLGEKRPFYRYVQFPVELTESVQLQLTPKMEYR